MENAPAFVPVVAGSATRLLRHRSQKRCGVIIIEIAGVVVHAEPGVDPGWLREVLRTVRAPI
jgi:hypothetical protein